MLEIIVAAPKVLAVVQTHLEFRTDDAPILGPNAESLKVELSSALPAALEERAKAPERLAEARRIGRRAIANFVLRFLIGQLPEALGDTGPVRFVRVRYQGENGPLAEATLFSVAELQPTAEPAAEPPAEPPTVP